MKGYVELLEAAGFKKGRPDSSTRADAAYYKRIRGPKCNCNEKSPSLGIKVYESDQYKKYGHDIPTGFEFSLYGELKNRTWLHLNLYSINEQQLNNLAYYVRVAEAVWLAAYSEDDNA